jgi:uncharacterized protein
MIFVVIFGTTSVETDARGVEKVINEIIRLREKGYTLQQIAEELNLTIGKVQYRWNKYRKDMVTVDKVAGEEDSTYKNEKSTDSNINCSFTFTIPSEYPVDEMRLVPKDPNSLYTYWQLSHSKQSMVEHHFRTTWKDLPKFLMVHDVTSIQFQGHNAHRTLEIQLPEMTNNWFINNVEENRTYVIDFGTKTFDGSFFTILRSNPIDTPRASHNELSRFEKDVHNWKYQQDREPAWIDNFSTYSYYQKIK